MLEFVILLSLDERERYGFELVSGIAKRATIDVPEGTLYPLLLCLAKYGLILSRLAEGDGGAPRKYYALTNHGREILQDMIPAFTDRLARRRWDDYFAEVDPLLARAGAGARELRGDLEAHVADSMAVAAGASERKRLDVALSG